MKYFKGSLLPDIAVFLCMIVAATYALEPDIEVTPDSFIDTLAIGQMAVHEMVISNTGSGDLVFYIWIEGLNNYALRFDGINDYGEVPDNPELSAIGDFYTLEFWMRIEENPVQHREVLGKWGPGGVEDDEYAVGFENGSLVVTVSGSGGYSEVWSDPLQSGTWFHAAGVYDASTMTYKMYINGSLVDAITPVTLSMDRNTDQPFRIGTYDFWHAPNFKGLLDEVRIWNVARTQAEIQAYMYRDLSGSENGLIGYWKFNEGSGNTIYDFSPSGNNGTLYGEPQWVSANIVQTWLRASPTYGIVPADTSKQIEVALDATSLWGGDYYQKIIVISNDPNEPEITIPVYLHVLGTPDIVVTDTILNFGIVNIGDSAIKSLPVGNVGDAWLMVNNVYTDNPAFAPDTTAFRVMPLSNHQLMVTFKPTNPGVKTGTLSILSNDPDEDTVTVALLGAGMTGIAEEGTAIASYAITGVFPNPFRKHTTISFSCPRSGPINLSVYDLSGRVVSVLSEGEVDAGSHSVRWDGTNSLDAPLPTGVYFLEFRTRDTIKTKKLLLLR